MAIRDDYEMVVGLEVHCELSTKTKSKKTWMEWKKVL